MHTDEPPSPGVNTTDIGHLITQFAHQIGENITSQLHKSVGSQDSQPTPTPSLNMSQGHSDWMTGLHEWTKVSDEDRFQRATELQG